MLNQVFSMIFGNSSSDMHSKATRQAPSSSDNKKRSAAEFDERAALSAQSGASDSEASPAKKRGRPPLRKNLVANMKKKVAKGNKNAKESDNESSHSADADVDRSNKRTRSTRSSVAMPSDSSIYDESEEDSEEDMPQAPVRRSSRSAVLNTAQQTPIAPVQRSTSETSAYSSYMSSALMRRSRRSRTVDLTKPLVVMLPGDDPREVAQLDLRGDIEWEEFLLAMSEDTTFMTSDNEDGPSDHLHLPHSSSVLSLSGLVGSADGPPSRSRNSSNSFSFASPLPAASTKGTTASNANSKKNKLDEKQVQYNEVMSVNVAATLSEVFVPDVKESELFKIITAINLLNDTSKPSTNTSTSGASFIQTPATITTTSKVRARARDGALHELVQQVLVDKRCGGYEDASMFIMPEHLRYTSEMYVDYDADSDDEQFVRDLQAKLSRPRTPRHSTTSPGVSKKTLVSEANIAVLDTEVVLKVRCFELMIARLEREFELARQFSAEPMQSTRTVPGTATSKITTSKDPAGASTNPSVPPVRQTIAAQLAATLEQAQASYELAKRFLKQPSPTRVTRKSTKSPSHASGKSADKHSPSVDSTSSSTPAARFTRHGQTASAHSVSATHQDGIANCLKDYNFVALEKLHRLGMQRQTLPTNSSAANLQDLAMLASNSLVRSGSVTDEVTAPKRVGRPPLLPRIPSQARTEAKPPVSSHLQKDAPEEPDEPFEEYYSAEQIASLLPESSTVQLLQAILRTFYGQCTEIAEFGADLGSAVKNKNKVGRPPKSRSNSVTESECDLALTPASVFGVEKDLIIAHEVYQYWQKKRAAASTSLIRAYHRYIMDLWERADNVSLPVPGDYLTGSLVDSQQHLIQVRRSLDRARLITDRVRRRERLKRDILRLPGEQLDALRAELSLSLVSADQSDSSDSPQTKRSRGKADTVSTVLLQPVPLAGSNLNGPVTTAGQGRDRGGKFLTARQSMARFGLHPTPKTPNNAKKSLSASSSADSIAGAKNSANAKSVRNQEIAFSIEPCSDDEDFAETDSGDESDYPFSDCISDSGSESDDNASIAPATVKVEKPATPANKATTSDSPVQSTNNKTKSSRSSSIASPDVKTEPAGTKADAKNAATKKTGAVTSNNTPKKRRHSAIADSDDDEDSEFEAFDDRRERLSVRGVRGQQAQQQHHKEPSQHSTPSSTETRRAARSASNQNNASVTPAPLTRHLSKSSAKKTPAALSSIDNSSKKGSRTRNSVPDCSLRHLPYSASKTPAESSTKKRRL